MLIPERWKGLPVRKFSELTDEELKEVTDETGAILNRNNEGKPTEIWINDWMIRDDEDYTVGDMLQSLEHEVVHSKEKYPKEPTLAEHVAREAETERKANQSVIGKYVLLPNQVGTMFYLIVSGGENPNENFFHLPIKPDNGREYAIYSTTGRQFASGQHPSLNAACGIRAAEAAEFLPWLKKQMDVVLEDRKKNYFIIRHASDKFTSYLGDTGMDIYTGNTLEDTKKMTNYIEKCQR